MKHALPFIALLFTIINAHAQMDPLYAQYLNNPILINPAYSGLNDNFNAAVSYRKQWAGFEGSPSTFNFSAHTSVRDNKMGIGLLALQDNIGNNKNTEINLTYAYRLNFSQTTVSFGLQGGLLNYRTDNSELNPYDPSDMVFAADQNILTPNFGAGIILKSERLFVGLSAPRLLANKTTFINQNNPNETVEGTLYEQHLYATLAYTIFFSERVRFKPSVLFKAVKGAPLSTDYNLTFNLDERYSAGVFSRNLNTIGFLTLIKFNEAYRMGYIFEIPTNQSVGTRYTTHEISFGLNMAVFQFHKTSITNF